MEGRGWQSHDRAEGRTEGGTEGRTQMDRDKGVRASWPTWLLLAGWLNSYLKTERGEF